MTLVKTTCLLLLLIELLKTTFNIYETSKKYLVRIVYYVHYGIIREKKLVLIVMNICKIYDLPSTANVLPKSSFLV